MNLSTTLALISIGLSGLKASGKVPPTIMGYIEVALDAITKAIAAVNEAKAGVDPTKLHEIDPAV